jgi:hypothetical protein
MKGNSLPPNENIMMHGLTGNALKYNLGASLTPKQ